MSGTYVPGSGPVLASLSVHLYPGVPVRVRMHPDDDRVVVEIGDPTGAAFLDLFVQRAELVVLADALADAVTDLDTAQHPAADNDTTDDRDETALADEVRAPAA